MLNTILITDDQLIVASAEDELQREVYIHWTVQL
jgi:hypothetical protein